MEILTEDGDLKYLFNYYGKEGFDSLLGTNWFAVTVSNWLAIPLIYNMLLDD
jgi:hypothetical protein